MKFEKVLTSYLTQLCQLIMHMIITPFNDKSFSTVYVFFINKLFIYKNNGMYGKY